MLIKFQYKCRLQNTNVNPMYVFDSLFSSFLVLLFLFQPIPVLLILFWLFVRNSEKPKEADKAGIHLSFFISTVSAFAFPVKPDLPI